MKREFQTFGDPVAWVNAAADLFYRSAQEAVGSRGLFAAALSGGKTPHPVYERLSLPPYRSDIDWPAVHLFWGDERCVPFDDPASNFGTARTAFLEKVPLPAENVHPVPVSADTCTAAADRYEKTLRRFFRPDFRASTANSREPEEPLFPVFDLILLGLGTDGHTASLFPGSPALAESQRWAVAVPNAPQPPFVSRVTLTLPVINRARTVLFLVGGKDKEKMVGRISRDWDKPSSPYPAARIRPAGKILWLVLEP